MAPNTGLAALRCVRWQTVWCRAAMHIAARLEKPRLIRDQNRFIERLPRADRRRLLRACESVALVNGDVLYAAGAPTRYAYFPLNGVVSLTASLPEDGELGLGLVGSEGVLGSHLALNFLAAPWRAQVLGAGTSWRISAACFARELATSAAIRQGAQHDLYLQLTQLAACAMCLHFHLIAPRLARYLLTLDDRVQSDDIRVTHEFLAVALGVRRVSITTAANDMQKGGLIEYRRGHLVVRNRAGLQAQSCSCYAAQRHALAALDQYRGKSFSRNITG